MTRIAILAAGLLVLSGCGGAESAARAPVRERPAGTLVVLRARTG
jgi:hypothetical protein